MEELKLHTTIRKTMEASVGEIVTFLGRREDMKKELTERLKKECFLELAEYHLEGFKYEVSYYLEEEDIDPYYNVKRFTGVLKVTLCIPKGGE